MTTPHLTIKIKDSCNFCCWRCSNSSETPVYVNSKGHVVRFSFKKSMDKIISNEKSFHNLKMIIEKAARKSLKETEQLRIEMEDKISSILLHKLNQKITISDIKKINAIIAKMT